MHKIVLVGATAAIFALGAAKAYALGAPNLSPQASPYAVLVPQSTMSEGRSAYTNGASPEAPFVDQGTSVAPEDRTYFSRGR